MREASVDSIVEYSKPIFKPGLVVCLIIRELWLPRWRFAGLILKNLNRIYFMSSCGIMLNLRQHQILNTMIDKKPIGTLSYSDNYCGTMKSRK